MEEAETQCCLQSFLQTVLETENLWCLSPLGLRPNSVISPTTSAHRSLGPNGVFRPSIRELQEAETIKCVHALHQNATGG